MKNLAIEGHNTRNREVIRLLEMLGGKNTKNFCGSFPIYYYIKSGEIRCNAYFGDNYKIYTLEEYFQKFPFRVDDKVIIPEYESEVRINAMKWDIYSETVLYMVHRVDEEEWYTTEELLDYNDIEDYKNIKSNKEETITIDDFKANTKEWLIDKLESMSKDNALQAICNLYNELHKPKYPKTFIEVLDFWHPDRQLEDDYQSCYKKDLIETFQDLLYARDAYWKIAENWKPNWSEETDKFTISNKCNKIYLNNTAWYSEVLAFPTAEMRDAFYDNFKDLIEKCKELL